jgi:hypothetical protein
VAGAVCALAQSVTDAIDGFNFLLGKSVPFSSFAKIITDLPWSMQRSKRVAIIAVLLTPPFNTHPLTSFLQGVQNGLVDERMPGRGLELLQLHEDSRNSYNAIRPGHFS